MSLFVLVPQCCTQNTQIGEEIFRIPEQNEHNEKSRVDAADFMYYFLGSSTFSSEFDLGSAAVHFHVLF